MGAIEDLVDNVSSMIGKQFIGGGRHAQPAAF